MFAISYVLVLPPTFHYYTHSCQIPLVHLSSNVKSVIIYQSPSIGLNGFECYPSSVSSVRANIKLDFYNLIMYSMAWFLH